MDDTFLDDDTGYADYVESTIDPGVSLLIATTILCIMLYAFLPCMVSLGKKSTPAEPVKEESSEVTKEAGALDTEAIGQVDQSHAAADESDNKSVQSNTSRASAVINAILDAAPHSRAGQRRAQIERRLHLLETQSVSSIPNSHGSALGRIDPDEVSFHDAVGEPPFSESRVKGGEKGLMAFQSTISNSFDNLLAIAEWDYETRRIWKLSLPFVVSALVYGMAEVGRVAIIGQLLGTKEISAYVIVTLFVGLSTDFIGGLHQSLVTLCSHSIGAGNQKLTGQYVQIAIVLYVILFIPIGICWILIVGYIMNWLGFDEETAAMAESFTPFYVGYGLLYGISAGIDHLLDVTNRQVFSTVYACAYEVLCTTTLLLFALFGDATLKTVGYIYVVAQFIRGIAYVVIIGYMGWFRKYYEGFFGSFALLNIPALKRIVSTSTALGFGYLLTYGEWEILTIFASFLGPAEVAAWGLLGTIWGALEIVTLSVGDAAEVRCAFLLGNDQPAAAKMSAYKSIFLAFLTALVLTSAAFIAGDALPRCLTKDETLQRLIADLIPIFGIGNISLTLGNMAWTLVGSQGRYRLSTTVGFIGSWFVTIPLAAVFSVVLKIDLQGQTAAIVIGYMVSGTINTYFLLTSDWAKLSSAVIKHNAAHVIVPSDDDDNDRVEDQSAQSS